MNRNLIIVRHAIAKSREEFAKTGLNDKKRPLTSFGSKKMMLISEWLSEQLKAQSIVLDYLCESPLVRSKQTVEILSKKISFIKRTELKSLDPETSLEVLAQALDSMVWSNLLIVGHEPHLSLFLSFILGVSIEENHSPFKFKKGGIAIVKVKGKLLDRVSELSLFVAPKHITK
jgi:phosphohistidine phosphatase SixA